VSQKGRSCAQVHLWGTHELRGHCVAEGVRGHAFDRCAFRLTAHGQSEYTGGDPVRLRGPAVARRQRHRPIPAVVVGAPAEGRP
jgi:hypothetical protein